MADRSTTPSRVTMFGALVALVFSVLIGVGAPPAHAAQSCACDDRPLANRLALGEAAVVGTVTTVESITGGTKAQVRLTASYNTSLASSRTDVEINVPSRCPVPAVPGQSFVAFIAASGSGIIADGSCSTLSAQTLAAAVAAATTPSADAAALLGWTSEGAPVGIDERGDLVAVGNEVGVRDVVICPGGAVGVVLDRSGGLRQLRLADLALGEALRPSGASLAALVACHDSVGLTITATTIDARVVVVNAGSVGYSSAGSVSSGGSAGDLVAHRSTQASSSPVLVTDVRTATTSILSTNVVDGRIDLGPDGRSVLSTRSLSGGAIEVTLHTDLDAAAQVHRKVTAILVSGATGVDLETDIIWLSTDRWAVKTVRDGRHQWSVHDRSGSQVGLLATDVATGRSRAASERLALVGASGNRVVVIEPSLATKRLAVDVTLAGVQALPGATLMTPTGSRVRTTQAVTLSTNTSSGANNAQTATSQAPTTIRPTTVELERTPSTTSVVSVSSTTSSTTPRSLALPATTQFVDTVPVSVQASVTVPVSTFTSSGEVRSTVVTPDDLDSVDDPGSVDGSVSSGDPKADGDALNDAGPVMTSGLVGIPVTRPTVITPDAIDDASPNSGGAQPAAVGNSAATVAVDVGPASVDEQAQADVSPGVDDGLGSFGLVVLLGGFVAIIAAVVGVARWTKAQDANAETDDQAEGYFLYEPESQPGRADIDLRDSANAAEPRPANPVTLDEDWSGKAAGAAAPDSSTKTMGVTTIARQAVSEQD